MHNAIHIEVEVIELLAVRVGTSRINRYLLAIDVGGKLFYYGTDNLRI